MPSGIKECPKCHEMVSNRAFKNHYAACNGSDDPVEKAQFDRVQEALNEKDDKPSEMKIERPHKYTNPIIEKGLKPEKKKIKEKIPKTDGTDLKGLIDKGILTVNIEKLVKCRHKITIRENYIRLEFDTSDIIDTDKDSKSITEIT